MFKWIPAKQKLADSLTKQGAGSLKLARAIENECIFDIFIDILSKRIF